MSKLITLFQDLIYSMKKTKALIENSRVGLREVGLDGLDQKSGRLDSHPTSAIKQLIELRQGTSVD